MAIDSFTASGSRPRIAILRLLNLSVTDMIAMYVPVSGRPTTKFIVMVWKGMGGSNILAALCRAYGAACAFPARGRST